MIGSAELQTQRLLLRTLDPADAPEVLGYQQRAWPFVGQWQPLPDAQFFTVEGQRARLEAELAARESGAGVRFFIFQRERPAGPIIGDLNLSNIIRGAFQSCFLGYKMDGAYTNRGYMTEAVRQSIDFAFKQLRLHRIEANIIPRNAPSRRVVAKLGFSEEGLSRSYLKINGVWEDHLHYVLLNPDEE
jgi:ribosomal-protein-alanine N-acetyltransferase